MAETEKEKIQDTDKVEDTKKADNLENEAKADKENDNGEETKNFGKGSLEQAYDAELNNRFVAKTMADLKQGLSNLTELIISKGDAFTNSETKTGNEIKDENAPDEKRASLLEKAKQKIKF